MTWARYPTCLCLSILFYKRMTEATNLRALFLGVSVEQWCEQCLADLEFINVTSHYVAETQDSEGR